MKKMKANYSRLSARIEKVESENEQLLKNIQKLNEELRWERRKFVKTMSLSKE